ncbi:hypothetical protein O1611_g9040 [Lasiodiplodia mahajangana]|uniref:Uncharacterized protein n=1 Tax=Lasiodiplodia mahajangana TaxID=1108764 RepID=A0ACC2JB36_9PEZI|nr:hypothetical protein O1611_g9040 [Lasiodiplodia mahajangana]
MTTPANVIEEMASGNRPGNPLRETQCHVMDVVDNEEAEGAPLKNTCYQRLISEISLDSEDKATYKCRWIHSTTMLRLTHFWEDGERRKIMTALRTLKYHRELRGMNGPNFRPGLYPLFDEEWHENFLHCLEQTNINSDQPMLVVIPTLHVGAPWSRLYPKPKNKNWTVMHFSKSLLEYHYRFNGDLDDASGTEAVISPTPASVRELWCVVVDKRNIITASNLRANSMWPNAKDLKQPTPTPSVSFSYAFWENPPFNVNVALNGRFRWVQNLGWARTPVVILGLLGFSMSRLVPDGRLIYKLNDFITKKLCGLEFSTMMRLSSFSTIVESAKPKVTRPPDSFFFWMRGTGIAKIKVADTNIASLRKILRELAQAEAEMRLRMHEEGPSEEVFTNLKRLWTIALVFSSNFYLDPDGRIYSLRPRVIYKWTWFPWRRGKRKAKQQGEPPNSRLLDMPIYYHPRKPRETVRDLEHDLVQTLEALNRQKQSSTGTPESEKDNDMENAVLLEEINKSSNNPALFCLSRVCIFSTPARFSSFNRLVVDFYAKRISRLEWLIRDQATQSLVYQLTRLADEIRIVKDIVISQRKVVSDVADRFLAAISPDPILVVEGLATEIAQGNNQQDEEAHTCNQGTEACLRCRKPRAAKTLQTKARIKHQNLLADLEKLEETAERLKTQIRRVSL